MQLEVTENARELRVEAAAIKRASFKELNEGREVCIFEPVAIELTSLSFILHYEKDGHRYAMKLSSCANFAFSELTKHGATLLTELDDAAILELRKYGVLELTKSGEVPDLVALSKPGVKVSKILTEIELEPAGTIRRMTA